MPAATAIRPAPSHRAGEPKRRQLKWTTPTPANPTKAKRTPDQGPVPRMETLPCHWRTASAKTTASPSNRVARVAARQPTNRRARPRNAAKERAVPNHGPRLRVKAMPSSWIAKTTPQPPVIPEARSHCFNLCPNLLRGAAGSVNVTTLAISVIGMVMDMTAAEKIAFPMKDVARSRPPPVLSVKSRKS